jgi:beta-mannosidase
VTPRVETHGVEPLVDDWTLARAEPGAPRPEGCWPAAVPGTVAAALVAAGEPAMGLDAYDWWFQRPLDVAPPEPGEEVVLRLGGIATIADVEIGGECLLSSPSMFARHTLDLGPHLDGRASDIAIACRSLARASERPPRSRPRFRAPGIDRRLRHFRTTLLGRGPGEAEVVGPYRPALLVRRRTFAIDSWWRRARLDGRRGRFDLDATVRPLGTARPRAARLLLSGGTGEHACDVRLTSLADGRVRMVATLRIDDVAGWLPHTHGAPDLYDVRIDIELVDGESVSIDDVPTGFRAISCRRDEGGGFAIEVSGVPVFCRGAIWAPADSLSLAPSPAEVLARLTALRDAGLNMIRVPGGSIWEDDEFHRTCDRLGVLVWQDLMLTRMDYPLDDPEFASRLTDEVRTELRRVGRHPSSTVICGGNEVEQQEAMMGVAPRIGLRAFTDEVLPALVAELCDGLPLVPCSPSGGDLPFRVSTGVAHYFGVGAYMRPLADARAADIRFASECLAFANVPEQDLLDRLAADTDPELATPGTPGWKRGVPRDPSASWDFDDVRDHYFREAYGLDPVEARRRDADRYLDLSRVAGGEAMAATIGEWRRAASRCAGALVLAAADTAPGAGWGLLDVRGRPKPALAILRRVCLPRAVWILDEGLDGLDVHLANDTPDVFACTLRVALYRNDGTRVAAAEDDVTVAARAVARVGVEELLGRFLDASGAYRFGPRQHDLAVASVHVGGDPVPCLQAFHALAPRSLRCEPPATLGLGASAEWRGDALHLLVGADRPAWGVCARMRGLIADDAWFGLEPGRPRRVVLRPSRGECAAGTLSIAALNAATKVAIEVPGQAGKAVEEV